MPRSSQRAHSPEISQAIQELRADVEAAIKRFEQKLSTGESLRDLPMPERCKKVTDLIEKEKLTLREIATEHGVDMASVLNWSRPGRLIQQVRDAFEEGENVGISLRNLKHFFNSTKGNAIEPKSPEEQLRLLPRYRGRGRGGPKRKGKG